MRETALLLAKQQVPDEVSQQQLLSLMDRALQSLKEVAIENPEQATRNDEVIEQLGLVRVWLQQVPIEDDLWIQLTDWAEAALSLETQELINALLIELYPEHVDVLEDSMTTEETLELTPDMPLVQLKQLIETHFDWAINTQYVLEDADSDTVSTSVHLTNCIAEAQEVSTAAAKAKGKAAQHSILKRYARQ